MSTMEKKEYSASENINAFKFKTTFLQGTQRVRLSDLDLASDDAIATLKARLPVLGGDAIETRLSTIANAGQGLFVKRAFTTNEIVTYYEGALVKYISPKTLDPKLRSHARTLFPMYSMLLGNVSRNGTRMINSDEKGIGGGAWINDPRPMDPRQTDGIKPNVMYEHVDDMSNDNDPMLRNPNGRLIIVVALRDISAGEEIFVSYGKDYWTNVANDMVALKHPVAKLINIADVPSLLVVTEKETVKSRSHVKTIAPILTCANSTCYREATGLCAQCRDVPYCSPLCCEQDSAIHMHVCTLSTHNRDH
jgi:hypothetical protein